MVRSIRHKALKRLFEKNDRSGVPPEMLAKVIRTLAALHIAKHPEDLSLPGFRNHQLTGDLAGFWSLSVRGNHRIIYRMEEGDVFDVDLVDYH